MEQRDEELIQALLPQNAELKAAYDEHTTLKSAVDGLQSRSLLTADEELSKKELQKRKLAVKDKIMQILAGHRRGHASEQAT